MLDRLGPSLLRWPAAQVKVHKKTQEERFPSLKKYSDRSSAADACHGVEPCTEYKVVLQREAAGGQMEQVVETVAPEEAVKAYRCVCGGGGALLAGARLRHGSARPQLRLAGWPGLTCA
jgi:hypothetical protein